jgi:hypothetical protein
VRYALDRDDRAHGERVRLGTGSNERHTAAGLARNGGEPLGR